MTLQIIIKRANKVNQKLRVRKFKSRVLNKLKVKNSFRGRRHARKLEATVFVTKTSRLIRHKVLMGIEKSVVVTKQFFRPAYYGYPDLYVTKKNQHSRMGKGKGKLRGRIQKLKPGAPFLEIFPHDTRFSGRWVRNILSAAPGRMNVIAPMPFAASALALFYLRRPWLAYSQMRKKTAAAKYAKKRRQSPTRLVRKKWLKMHFDYEPRELTWGEPYTSAIRQGYFDWDLNNAPELALPLSDIPRRFFTVFPLKDIRDLRFREKGLSMKLRALVFGARFRTFKCWWHYRKTPGYQRPWVYASVTRFCNLFGRSWGKRLRVPRNRVRTAQVWTQVVVGAPRFRYAALIPNSRGHAGVYRDGDFFLTGNRV